MRHVLFDVAIESFKILFVSKLFELLYPSRSTVSALHKLIKALALP